MWLGVLRKRATPRMKDGSGQALAETALVLIILLMMLSMIVDVGRMMFTWLAMQNAAAEGAYYAASFSDGNHDGEVGGTNKDTIIYRVQNESASTLLNWKKPGVDVTLDYITEIEGADPVVGDSVVVGIKYPFDFIGPLPGIFGFSNINLYAQATQLVLRTNLE